MLVSAVAFWQANSCEQFKNTHKKKLLTYNNAFVLPIRAPNISTPHSIVLLQCCSTTILLLANPVEKITFFTITTTTTTAAATNISSS